MHPFLKLRRLAEHHERIARIELAHAERARAEQERAVAQAADAMRSALGTAGEDPSDHFHRHGYALRMEMARRGAERRLLDHQKEVGVRREAMATAMREKGTLDRLVELHETAVATEQRRTEQQRLDEAGLHGWWRRG